MIPRASQGTVEKRKFTCCFTGIKPQCCDHPAYCVITVLTMLSWLFTNKYLERVIEAENGRAVLCCDVFMSSEILIRCLGFVRHLFQVIAFVATNISTQTLQWTSDFFCLFP